MWPFSKKKEALDYTGLPKVSQENMVPMPKVKPCKPEPTEGISEPILSFVELFNKNHRRFTVDGVFRGSGDCYTLKDKVTNEEFNLVAYYGRYRVKGNLWITEFEVKYIYNVISTFHKERAKRKAELVNSRKRKKYMKIYGSKENVNV